MRTHYPLDVGDIRCIALRAAAHDPTIRLADLLLPPSGGESARAEEERTATLQGTHSCLLARVGDRTLLIDGGLESAAVLASLHGAGVDENDVQLVLITHGDTDHIAGLVDERHRLVYRRARYVLHRDLWEAWVSDGTRGDPDPFYEEEQRKIARVLAERIGGRVQPLGAEGEVEPGIRAIAAPGHRPSHFAYELESGDRRLLHTGDAIIAPILVQEYSRGNAFDTDPELGVTSRLKLLRRAVHPGTVVFAPHFPFPGFVRIVERDGRFSCAEP